MLVVDTNVIRVLVLEDHPDTRDLYVEFLREAGFEVYGTADATDALQLATVHEIDIAILDLSLGFGIVRDLVALRPAPRLVAVTGRSPDGTGDEAVFAAYLVKPCLPNNLLRSIQEVVGTGQ